MPIRPNRRRAALLCTLAAACAPGAVATAPVEREPPAAAVDARGDTRQPQGADPADAPPLAVDGLDVAVAADLAASPDAAALDATPPNDAASLDTGDTSVAGAPPRRSSGCGRAGTPPRGEQTLVFNGKSRTFLLYPPRGYDPNRAYPIAFGFAGYDRPARDFIDNPVYGYAAAFGDRAILVYPDALPDRSGKQSWYRDPLEDMDFVEALIAHVGSTLCADPGRVLAGGHSAGAFFVNGLGCQRGDKVRLVVAVAGGLFGLFGTPASLMKNCKGAPAAYLVHGTKDMVAPIKQGLDTRAFWTAKNGCSLEPAATTVPRCVAYAGCAPEAPVFWCQHEETAYGNTGHGWPTWVAKGMWDVLQSLP